MPDLDLPFPLPADTPRLAAPHLARLITSLLTGEALPWDDRLAISLELRRLRRVEGEMLPDATRRGTVRAPRSTEGT